MARGQKGAKKLADSLYTPIYIGIYVAGENELCPKLGTKSKGWDNFQELYRAISKSIRLGEATKLEDKTGVVFQHTNIFQEYINIPSFKDFREHADEHAHTAWECGLISRGYYERFRNPDSDALIKTAFKRLNPIAKIQHPVYIQHISDCFNVSAFNAIMRVYEWAFRDSDDWVGIELKSDPIYAEYHNRMMSDRIDHFGTTAPSAERSQQALDWLQDLDNYFTDQGGYLDQVVAEINVEVGTIDPSCEMDKGQLLNHIYEANGDELGKFTPSVVSLFSRERYLGEKNLKFQADGRSYNIQQINELIMVGKSQVKILEDRVSSSGINVMFRRVKRSLTEAQIITWNLRLQKYNKFEEALKYWDSRIHWIGIDWNKQGDPSFPPYKSFEEGNQFLEDLIQVSKTIDSWIGERVFDELINAREAQYRPSKEILETISKYNLNTLSIAEGSAGKKNNALKTLQKVWSKTPISVGKYEDVLRDKLNIPKAENGKTIKEGVVSAKKDKPSAPSNVVAEVLPDKDMAELVAGFLETFDELGHGIHQAHVMLFLGCTKPKKDKKGKWIYEEEDEKVKLPNGAITGRKRKKAFPKHGEDFVSSIFHFEHPDKIYKEEDKDGNKKRVGHIMIHPVYQKFVMLFEGTIEHINKTCKETKRKFKTLQGRKGMRGIESIIVAKWLLNYLPKLTKARIEFFSKQVLKEEQKGND